jgi:hypothetical protein
MGSYLVLESARLCTSDSEGKAETVGAREGGTTEGGWMERERKKERWGRTQSAGCCEWVGGPTAG